MSDEEDMLREGITEAIKEVVEDFRLSLIKSGKINKEQAKLCANSYALGIKQGFLMMNNLNENGVELSLK